MPLIVLPSSASILKELAMQETLPQMILRQAAVNPTRSALRRKLDGQYRDITWEEMTKEVFRFGKAILTFGLQPGDRLAIMASNGPEWVYADMGTMAAGGITVPIYQNEGLDGILHIINDSGCRLLFLQSPVTARELAVRISEIPALERVITLEGRMDYPRFQTLADFLAAGESLSDQDLEHRLATGSPDDIATLVYTSGTTGPPKGVMLTHNNILANVEAAVKAFPISADDVSLSFLPLSHVFERVDGYYLMLHQGAVIAYAESIDSVPLNTTEVQPTVVISVPRLYEKIFARIMERALSEPWPKKQAFFSALRIGRAYTDRRLSGQKPGLLLNICIAMSRLLVFSQLRKRLGGRLRFFISGGAPLARNVAEFFLAADIPIYEGYGMTETAAGIAANSPGHLRLGTVGKPLGRTVIRIAEDGEILVRGPGVFQGYWQRPELNEEVFVDGWFKTGDVGATDLDGYLSITDRKKDLIITAGGENIAPQNLENRFKSDKYLSNALVYGDRKPFLTALLVPNFENLEKYARHKEIDFLNHCDLVNHHQVLDLVRRRINTMQDDLPAFSRIKRFTLLSRDFSAERGEVTPTLKIKRKAVAKNFKQVIEGMYQAQDHGRHDSGFCVVEEG